MTAQISGLLQFKSGSAGGAEYLRNRLSPELRDQVKWFHSGMTDEFREEETHTLLIGELIGDAATDAIGMVCSLNQSLVIISNSIMTGN